MTAATALIGHSRRHIDLFLTASALCPRLRSRRPQTRTPSGETMTLAPARTVGTPGIDRFTPVQLLRTARLFASDPALSTLLDRSSDDRQWAELDSSAALQVWLIGWPAGTDTGWQTRARRRASVTVQGALQEQTWSGGRLQERRLTMGAARAFGGRHVHHVATPARSPRCRSTSTRRG